MELFVIAWALLATIAASIAKAKGRVVASAGSAAAGATPVR